MDTNYWGAILIACLFPLALLVYFFYRAWRDRSNAETVVKDVEEHRKDWEIEFSMYRLEKIRLSKMPEGVRAHLMGAAIRELLDLIEGKQRPWRLDYLLFGGKHGS